MLEVRAVVRAGCQYRDGRVAHARGRHGAQVVEQHVGVVIDRCDRNAREEIGEQPHHHLAVFEHVRDARRRAQVVFEHVKRVAVDFDDIDAGHVHVNVGGHVDAAHFRAEQDVAEDLLLGNDAGLDDFLAVINVFEKSIQRAHALAAAVGQSFPRARPHDARDDVERDRALDARIVAVHRERNTLTRVQRVGFLLLLQHEFDRLRAEPVREGGIMLARRAGLVIHFVEPALRG